MLAQAPSAKHHQVCLLCARGTPGNLTVDDVSCITDPDPKSYTCCAFSAGVSSRVPEIMATGTHSPGGPNGIIRSQSFAGFSTLQERRSR